MGKPSKRALLKTGRFLALTEMRSSSARLELGDCAFGDAHDLLLAARRIYSQFAVRFAEAVHDPALRRRVFRLPLIFLRELFRLNDFKVR